MSNSMAHDTRCPGLHQPGANTETVVFELKFGVKAVRQRPHQLKAQPAIGVGVEIFRKADAVIRHLDHE